MLVVFVNTKEIKYGIRMTLSNRSYCSYYTQCFQKSSSSLFYEMSFVLVPFVLNVLIFLLLILRLDYGG